MPDINTTYDSLLETELTKRLGRAPSPEEITNADNDSDLVNEILWQLVCQLSTLHTVNANNIAAIADVVEPLTNTVNDFANTNLAVPAISNTEITL